MTKSQRITLMADWWPAACRTQGWNVNDRQRRMDELSRAVGRPLASANELNSTSDVDAVKAHLGMLADNVAATIETDHPEQGRARRLRITIREQLKCLGIYLSSEVGRVTPCAPSPAEQYLAEIIKDKFKHGSRAMPLTIDDLNADPITARNRFGGESNIPSQLDQVIMTLARSIQAKRKAAGHSIHEMKKAAGVPCHCSACTRPPRTALPAPEMQMAGVDETNEPF